MIWFSSDTHYNHRNMCYGVSDWVDKETSTRKFDTLKEMNEAMVSGINNSVKQDDTLYFLGDWSFGGVESVWEFRKRIICKNIHFIVGNHDQHIKKNKQIGVVTEDSVYFNNLGLFEISIYPQHFFSSVSNYLELLIDKQIYVLCHYPMEEWYEMDRKGSVMLHGHTHGTINGCELNTKYKRMDVGIDWKEFRPYSIDEINEIMNKREIKTYKS